MSRNKSCKNFKQTAKPWKSIPYPSAPYYVADSGCGATACADLIVTNPKYAKKTPTDTAKWMVKNGYAYRGDGTAWAGITACLKHYGFKVTQHDDMESFWKEMKKAGRMAVISFRGGTRGGVTWTLGGHFLACSGMEIKNGMHRLYMLDPGPRNNNGWFYYEKHMKGLIAQLWTCYLPEAKKKVKEVATKKKTEKKTMKELVAYAKKRANQHTKYGRKYPMSWKTHYDCHWMTKNIFNDCGYPEVYKRIAGDFWKSPDGKKHLGPYLVQRKKSGLDKSKLKPGDIVVKRLKNYDGYHSATYIGGGKVAHTTSAKGCSNIGKLTKKYIMAFRIPEPYTAEMEVIKTRALRKNWTSKSETLQKLKQGTRFKTNKRRGRWVHVSRIRVGNKWEKVSGWVCIKTSAGEKRCKKIK